MAELPRTTATSLGRVWQDTFGPTAALPTDATAPGLVNMTSANIKQYAYALNDLCYVALQLPHGTAPGSDIRVHVHFTFPSQPTAGRYIQWESYYTLAAINSAFSAESAVQKVEYQVQATDALVHRVVAVFTATAPAAPRSAILLFRIKRIDRTTGSESDVSPVLLFADAHIQLDEPGSVTET